MKMFFTFLFLLPLSLLLAGNAHSLVIEGKDLERKEFRLKAGIYSMRITAKHFSGKNKNTSLTLSPRYSNKGTHGVSGFKKGSALVKYEEVLAGKQSLAFDDPGYSWRVEFRPRPRPTAPRPKSGIDGVYKGKATITSCIATNGNDYCSSSNGNSIIGKKWHNFFIIGSSAKGRFMYNFFYDSLPVNESSGKAIFSETYDSEWRNSDGSIKYTCQSIKEHELSDVLQDSAYYKLKETEICPDYTSEVVVEGKISRTSSRKAHH